MAPVKQGVVIWAAHPLDHPYKHHVICGIDPEPRPRSAVPEERASTIRQICLAGIRNYSAVIAIPESRTHHMHPAAELACHYLLWQVIRRHKLHGFR